MDGPASAAITGVIASLLTWWGGWLPAFVLTCVIELPVYLLMFELFGVTGPSPDRSRRRLTRGMAAVLVVLVNAVTHPLFWWAALGLTGAVELLAGELLVTFVEAALILAVSMLLGLERRPVSCLACAAVANTASAVLGSALLTWIVPA